MGKNAYLPPNHSKIGFPIIIDHELCNGCNTCTEACRSHLILPNKEQGQPPLVYYPEECWYCGCCVADCPAGAITLRSAVSQSVGWKRKATGEYFRLGMKNPPASNTRPPVY
jgi:NAD-dependent dihydropyrimidine dehydrogenase PreA subunit